MSGLAASLKEIPLNEYTLIVPFVEPIKILLHSSAIIPPDISAVFAVIVSGVPTTAPLALLIASKFLRPNKINSLS